VKAALRLLLMLSALVAGEAAASRVEVAVPRAEIVQVVRVEARRLDVVTRRSTFTVTAPAVFVVTVAERSAADRGRPLYLLHRALLH
jgi:hypothetical protein